jgi:hypothetical protein
MAGAETNAAESVTPTIDAATTLDDGSLWTAAALSVLAPLDVTAGPADGAPTTLAVAGGIALGGAGALDLAGGSTATAAALALGAGAGITLLDGYSGVVLGAAGPMQGGAVVVGNGAQISAADGSVVASLVLNGGLAVSAGGTLVLNGVLSGGGTAQVGADAELSIIANAIAFTGTIALAPGATLALGAGDVPQATLAMDLATVDLQGVAWANGLPISYDAKSGVLVLGNAMLGTATLDVGPGATVRDFAATSDANGGTILTEQHDHIWLATASGAGGDWADPAHWFGASVPQASDSVAIGPGLAPATPWTVGIGTAATAAQLTLAMGGTGTLHVTSGLAVGDGADAGAGTIAVGAGGVLVASAAVIAGDIAMQGGSAALTGPAAVLAGSLSGFGAVTLDGAVLAAAGGFAGTLTVEGTVTLASGGAPTGLVRLEPLGGAPAALDLRGVAWRAGATPGYDAATGMLTAGGATLDIGTGQNAAEFAAMADGAGGTLLTTRPSVTTSGTGRGSTGGGSTGTAGDPAPPVACFAAGTAILTPRGPVPIEHLAIGDLVVTRAHPGRPAAPIGWIGHCRVDPAAHPAPATVQPVRIRRDAVAPGVPARDLRLSPDHAVALGGVLIPVKYLVNGATIVRERTLAPVAYYHLELEPHDIVLAEALPAETYLDTGNRAVFEAGASTRPRTWEADACATLMGEGPVVAAVRARLAARAALLSRRGGRAPSARAVPAPRWRGWRSAALPAV